MGFCRKQPSGRRHRPQKVKGHADHDKEFLPSGEAALGVFGLHVSHDERSPEQPSAPKVFRRGRPAGGSPCATAQAGIGRARPAADPKIDPFSRLYGGQAKRPRILICSAVLSRGQGEAAPGWLLGRRFCDRIRLTSWRACRYATGAVRLIFAGWLPQDGLFGRSATAGLEKSSVASGCESRCCS
jgi:hypothetical protein